MVVVLSCGCLSGKLNKLLSLENAFTFLTEKKKITYDNYGFSDGHSAEIFLQSELVSSRNSTDIICFSDKICAFIRKLEFCKLYISYCELEAS